MSNKVTVNAVAEKPTVSLSFSDRVLGRLVKIDNVDDVPAARDLASDMFWNLYKSEPRTRDDVPAERRVNEKLIDWARSTPGFETARANSIGNMPASSLSSALLAENLRNDEIMGEIMRAVEELEKLSAERDAKRSESAGAQMAADATDDADAAEQFAQRAADAADAADKLGDAVDQLAQQLAEAVDGAKENPIAAASMSAATRAASSKAAETARIMAGFGLAGASDVRTDPAAAAEFARRANDKIRRIAELAGRVKGFALKSYRETVKTGSVLTRVELTNRIDRVMPSERALLRPDAPAFARAETVGRLVSDGLLGFAPAGDGEKSGPFVFGLDVSGSMGIGERLIVGRAVGIGLAMAARELGREFVLFDFAADSSKIGCVTSRDSWADVMEWAARGAGGGTDFDMAIDFALLQLVKLERVKRADLVFASDGEGRVSNDTIARWNRVSDDTGARLFYVPVDGAAARYAGTPNSWFNIGKIADRIFPVPDFSGGAAVQLASGVGAAIH